MSESPLVSVIIPAYNKQAHISAALGSVISQDYSNLEIVLVNDASTDLTRSIALELLEHSTREFTLIDHQSNLGVSSARNAGLEASRGEYVVFCDADDIEERNLVSELAGIIGESDISFCGIINRYEDGRPDEFMKVPLKSSPLDGEEALYMRMLGPVVPHLCAMMFRRSFLAENVIRFHDGCIAFEDIEFQIKAMCHARRVSFSDKCLYVYVHGLEMGTIRDNDTREKKLRRYKDSSEAHYRLAEYIGTHAPSKRVKKLADDMLLPEAVIRKFTVCSKSKDYSGFRELLNEENRGILWRSFRCIFTKPEIFMKALCILAMPGLYFKLRSKI